MADMKTAACNKVQGWLEDSSREDFVSPNAAVQFTSARGGGTCVLIMDHPNVLDGTIFLKLTPQLLFSDIEADTGNEQCLEWVSLQHQTYISGLTNSFGCNFLMKPMPL